MFNKYYLSYLSNVYRAHSFLIDLEFFCIDYVRVIYRKIHYKATQIYPHLVFAVFIWSTALCPILIKRDPWYAYNPLPYLLASLRPLAQQNLR
jgi:hypothetical protein